MKIEIKAEGDLKTETLIFSNDGCEWQHVEMFANGNSYIIKVIDLISVVEALKRYKYEIL